MSGKLLNKKLKRAQRQNQATQGICLCLSLVGALAALFFGSCFLVIYFLILAVGNAFALYQDSKRRR